MKKSTKKWLVAAAALLVSGIALVVGVVAFIGLDLNKLSTVEFETKTYEIDESVTNVSVSAGSADIMIVYARYGKCTVDCYQSGDMFSVTVSGDTLVITQNGKDPVDELEFTVASPSVSVMLPLRNYSSLNIETNSGGVRVLEGFVFENLSVSTASGDISCLSKVTDTALFSSDSGDLSLENVKAGEIIASSTSGGTVLSSVGCDNVSIAGQSGNVSLTGVSASVGMEISTASGDISLDECDAENVFITASSGNVDAVFLSEKEISAESASGEISVPDGGSGGRCEIKTSSGDIRVSVSPKTDG